jgi:hypothetical protein
VFPERPTPEKQVRGILTNAHAVVGAPGGKPAPTTLPHGVGGRARRGHLTLSESRPLVYGGTGSTGGSRASDTRSRRSRVQDFWEDFPKVLPGSTAGRSRRSKDRPRRRGGEVTLHAFGASSESTTRQPTRQSRRGGRRSLAGAASVPRRDDHGCYAVPRCRLGRPPAVGSMPRPFGDNLENIVVGEGQLHFL